ncbi:hypothetical protein WR25_00538 isoform O [Diploscapter pachys]|uniref:Sphingomyelin phosphodiesterase n=2 Tax=Diploscapter pachys TaxID=2018661 RepID=A0A2A2KZM0_9BILA|nr:hypothetical protein WR25_00538 isoform E [Diploscapter pachys]PAV79283.1 hypothetical protein WR25_00538 isoform I [Diploscapter pachys]PAV79284.1 hypothetical protein WR25_00538 isoform J [Diploscapter pachys]PAV79289.1 hypothetical protein WR25_00538 isoform O [Diploscapter pachys]
MESYKRILLQFSAFLPFLLLFRVISTCLLSDKPTILITNFCISKSVCMWMGLAQGLQIVCLLAAGLVLSNPVNRESADQLLVSAECIECRYSVQLLESQWGEDTKEKCLADLVAFVCETFNIERPFICQMIGTNYEAEAVYVLSQILLDPKDICALLLSDCGTFFDPLVATWNQTIPPNKPPLNPKKPVQAGKPTLRVLHISDPHIDMDYQIGSEAQCDEHFTLCCRPLNDTNEAIRDQPIKEPAGKWGTTGICDAPYWMVDNLLQQIAQRHKDIDYVIVTGDFESHAIWDYARDTHQRMIRNVSQLIKSHFPDKQIYFALGNHEGVPLDSFAPSFTPEEFHMDWLYGTVADEWKPYIPADQDKTIRFNGCYMVKPWPGFRIISLNNGLGDSLNLFLFINQTDPDGTMSWLSDQLLDAEKAGDKVHIVAHIPPGTAEALEGWSLNYYKLAIRFENTIAAHIMAHVHSEEFYVIYEDPEDFNSRPVDVVFSAPCMTPYSRYNPTYRIYTIDGKYDGSTYQVIDFEEWIMNLTVANQPPYDPTVEQLYPSILKEYGFTANLPSEWSNMINQSVLCMRRTNFIFLG